MTRGYCKTGFPACCLVGPSYSWGHHSIGSASAFLDIPHWHWLSLNILLLGVRLKEHRGRFDEASSRQRRP